MVNIKMCPNPWISYYLHHPELLPEMFIHSISFTFTEKKNLIHSNNTRTKDNLHLNHSSSQHQDLDQLEIKLLDYGMTCHCHVNKPSHC